MNRQTVKITAIVLAVLSCGIGESAVADVADGNRMLTNCQTAIRVWGGDGITSDINLVEAIDSGFCFGFVQGVTGTLAVWQRIPDGSPFICLPDRSISDLQAARIFVKYLTEHPEKLHEMGIVLFLTALSEAFPCT